MIKKIGQTKQYKRRFVEDDLVTNKEKEIEWDTTNVSEDFKAGLIYGREEGKSLARHHLNNIKIRKEELEFLNKLDNIWTIPHFSKIHKEIINRIKQIKKQIGGIK